MASARDFLICAFCNDVVRPASAFGAHLASDDHRKRAEGNLVRCPVCTLYISPVFWTDHVSSASHRERAERLGLQVHCAAEIPAAVPGHKRCNMCKTFVLDSMWDVHLLGKEHAARIRARDEVVGAQAAIQRAKADKERISVSDPDGVDFGVVDLRIPDGYARAELMITTRSLEECYKLVGLKIRGISEQRLVSW
jgi:hypothetical protein